MHLPDGGPLKPVEGRRKLKIVGKLETDGMLCQDLQHKECHYCENIVTFRTTGEGFHLQLGGGQNSRVTGSGLFRFLGHNRFSGRSQDVRGSATSVIERAFT